MTKRGVTVPQKTSTPLDVDRSPRRRWCQWTRPDIQIPLAGLGP